MGRNSDLAGFSAQGIRVNGVEAVVEYRTGSTVGATPDTVTIRASVPHRPVELPAEIELWGESFVRIVETDQYRRKSWNPTRHPGVADKMW
jgi:hypothetical protein